MTSNDQLPTITLDELAQMIAAYKPETICCDFERWESGLFVRWSNDPTGDCSRGHSINWATGQGEMGLSAVELNSAQTWHGLDTGITLQERVMEYRFGNGRPWVVEGYRIAGRPEILRGSDNEPLVAYPRPVAWIS